MKVYLHVNPKAGSADRIEPIRTALAAAGIAVREPASENESVADAAARGGFDFVVAAGGDGTVHHVVNALGPDFPKAPLAVLPLGTGNDLCRTLAIPLDPAEAVELLRRPRVRAIDVARVEGGFSGWMANVATGGFSGKVAAEVTPDLKAAWGPLAYLRGAAGPVADRPTFRLAVRFDGGPPEHFDALNVVVANARTAAGGLPVAPTADPEDGLLDVVIVRAADALDLSVVAARLVAGDYTADENVIHRLAARVEFESDPPIPLSVDGELVEGRRFAFAVVPKALRVAVGPDYHPGPDPEPAIDAREPAEPRRLLGIGPRLFGLLGGLLLLLRRAPGGYVAGALLAGVAVAGFVWLAGAVAGGRVRAFDEAVMRAVRADSPDWLNAAMGLMTVFGGAAGAVVVTLAVLAVLLKRRRYADAAAVVVVMAGGGALELILKPAFAVARPSLFPPLTAATGYSFPSGHALRAVSLYGFLAALIVGWRVGAWRWAAAAGLLVLAAAVCWSRVQLGVHNLSDVAGGALVATGWVTACLIARHHMTRRKTVPLCTPHAEREVFRSSRGA